MLMLRDGDTQQQGETEKRTIAEGRRSEKRMFCLRRGAMIDDAVNDILLDRHFGGSIETTWEDE